MKATLFTIIRVLISAALLAFVVFQIGIVNIVKTFTSIRPSYLPPVIALYCVTLLLGGGRLWTLLKPIKKDIPATRVLVYSVLSWAVGLFTPGNLGEFSLIRLLSSEGIEISRGMAVLLIDKAILLSTLVIIPGLGMFILFDFRHVFYIFFGLVALFSIVWFAFRYLVYFKSGRIGELIKNIKSLSTEFLRHHKSLLLTNFILIILKWCITGSAITIIFVSLGISSNVFLVTLISMTIILVNIIPVTFHGLGLKEIAAIYLYGLIGIPEDVAVVASLFFSIVAYSFGLTIIMSLGSRFHRN